MPEPLGHDINTDDPRLEVKVATLAGQLALLTQSTSMSIGNMASTLSAVQADLRDVGNNVNLIKIEQHEVRSHSEGLDRIANRLDELSRSWTRDFKEHVRANDRVAEKVDSFSGGLKLAGVVLALVAALGAAYLNSVFTNMKEDDMKIERRLDRLEGLK